MISDFRKGMRTFVTWQKTLLFFQICIIIGLGVQLVIFSALLWYGRPLVTETALVLQFFQVCALWVLTINVGIWLFWWVTRQGQVTERTTTQSNPNQSE